MRWFWEILDDLSESVCEFVAEIVAAIFDD
jgi:hypothetical protein